MDHTSKMGDEKNPAIWREEESAGTSTPPPSYQRNPVFPQARKPVEQQRRAEFDPRESSPGSFTTVDLGASSEPSLELAASVFHEKQRRDRKNWSAIWVLVIFLFLCMAALAVMTVFLTKKPQSVPEMVTTTAVVTSILPASTATVSTTFSETSTASVTTTASLITTASVVSTISVTTTTSETTIQSETATVSETIPVETTVTFSFQPSTFITIVSTIQPSAPLKATPTDTSTSSAKTTPKSTSTAAPSPTCVLDNYYSGQGLHSLNPGYDDKMLQAVTTSKSLEGLSTSDAGYLKLAMNSIWTCADNDQVDFKTYCVGGILGNYRLMTCSNQSPP